WVQPTAIATSIPITRTNAITLLLIFYLLVACLCFADTLGLLFPTLLWQNFRSFRCVRVDYIISLIYYRNFLRSGCA
ncbi:MAG: hypothetical protein SCM11_16865, partial [Bacillota bacterium]|nr:hypothetical protein [Bacillota bacterium]